MSDHQPYDHALKSLMGDRAAEIIPQLLPEAEVVSYVEKRITGNQTAAHRILKDSFEI